MHGARAGNRPGGRTVRRRRRRPRSPGAGSRRPRSRRPGSRGLGLSRLRLSRLRLRRPGLDRLGLGGLSLDRLGLDGLGLDGLGLDGLGLDGLGLDGLGLDGLGLDGLGLDGLSLDRLSLDGLSLDRLGLDGLRLGGLGPRAPLGLRRTLRALGVGALGLLVHGAVGLGIALAAVRADHHGHVPAVLLGLGFDEAELIDVTGQALQQLAEPQFGPGLLAPAEHDRHLNLVPRLENRSTWPFLVP